MMTPPHPQKKINDEPPLTFLYLNLIKIILILLEEVLPFLWRIKLEVEIRNILNFLIGIF
jgi:hypothetical protein